jgi:hypothetical protein
MADWIFQGNRRHYDLDAAVAASREQWWGTPRYRDRMAVGDRVWLQIVGPKDPGIYYAATIVSQTYEHPVQPSDPAHFRWRTDIRFDYRISPPLLRFELLEDVQLGSFRPFRGFQGSNVPVPPDVAAALAARAAPRLEPLPRSGPRGNGLFDQVATSRTSASGSNLRSRPETEPRKSSASRDWWPPTTTMAASWARAALASPASRVDSWTWM